VQALAALAALAYSGLASFLLLRLVGAVVPMRADARAEGLGLDVVEHGEEAYTTGEGAVLLLDGETAAEAGMRPAKARGGEAA